MKYHEALFDIIGKQYEAAKLDESKDSPLQVLDEAVTPEAQTGPHRSLIIAMGLFMGLGLGTVYVLYRAARLIRTDALLHADSISRVPGSGTFTS